MTADVLDQSEDGAPGHRRWRTLMWLTALVTAVALAGVTLGSGLGRDPSVVKSVLVAKPAPELVGKTLGGAPFDLRSLRGQVVLVNVWASWCLPCKTEYPVLAAGATQFRPQGLRLVGINMKDRPEDARVFLAATGGARGTDVADSDARLAVTWGTFALPETYLVDPSGTIVRKGVGPVTADWISRNVVPLLGQP